MCAYFITIYVTLLIEMKLIRKSNRFVIVVKQKQLDTFAIIKMPVLKLQIFQHMLNQSICHFLQL